MLKHAYELKFRQNGGIWQSIPPANNTVLVLGRVGEEAVDAGHDLGALPVDELPEAVLRVALPLVEVLQHTGRPLLLQHPDFGVAGDVADELADADGDGDAGGEEERVHLHTATKHGGEREN
jgi:hypothetical protein